MGPIPFTPHRQPPAFDTVPNAPLAILHAVLVAGGAELSQTSPETPLVMTPAWSSTRYVRSDGPLAFTLSRPLRAGVEGLAILVGSVDLAGFATGIGTRIVVQPRGFRLPTGDHELTVYLVTDGTWTEVMRAPVKVSGWGGLESASLTPSVTLNSAGQITERTSASEPASLRRSFQDFTGTAGVQAALVRQSVLLQTQSTVVGVSERAQALRFAQLGPNAPLVDLADVSVALRRGAASLGMGAITLGQQRHLLQSFATRGVSAGLTRGPATLTLAVANGSSIVGWDNVAGVADPEHQLRTAMLGVELFPRHPGLVRAEGSWLGVKVRPDAGFTRGAILDAERNDGRGLVLSVQSPGQRVRMRAEWTLSRFESARDEQLTGDTAVVPLRPARRAARWAEVSLDVLRQHRLWSRVMADVSATVRHERVDPLFRSVGASPQADREETGGELAFSLGGTTLRVAHARAGDNLGGVPSVLRTETKQTSATAMLPLPQVLTSAAKPRNAFPTLAVSVSRTHALADGVPTNGDFRPVDLPDQLSTLVDGNAQWTLSRWRVAYRFNRSMQDNRQPGRERADFATTVNAITVGVTRGSALDVAIDATQERQEQREQGQEQRLRRVGTTTSWQFTRLAQLSANYMATVSRDRPSTMRGTQGDLRLELAHGFDVRSGPAAGGVRGRVFVRFQRLSAETRALAVSTSPPVTSGLRLRWSVATGLSYRLL